MKIIDENGVELENPDFSLGYLKEDVRIIHHEAIEGVKEEFHYETIREYPNGGKDVKKVIDVPGVEAKEAWDEEIPFLRYILYTEEELAEIEANRKPTMEDRIKELEEALELLLSGVTE
jgi:hypothetical protein